MAAIEYYLDSTHYDLVTPDGKITNLRRVSDNQLEGTVFIENISPVFVGFEIDSHAVFFNMKSTLAQVGVDGTGIEYELDKKNCCAQILCRFDGIGPIGTAMLGYLKVGTTVGKLFASDERRRVRDPQYLSRMFGRSDRWGQPLLSLGGMSGSDALVLEKVDGYAVAYLSLQNGCIQYNDGIIGFLPTLSKALERGVSTRRFLRLHQQWNPHGHRNSAPGQLLLVRTLPLHVRTVFARVVPQLLGEGYAHTNASILEPDTAASGDIYELYGNSKRELSDIPLEFYTLEPYREYVFFSDRDQLRNCLENEESLFNAFATAPSEGQTATFVVKGDQLLNLCAEDWIVRHPRPYEFPGKKQTERQALLIERYINQQPAYPFLKCLDRGSITSQGILLCRYFPSPLMKRMLLSDQVQRNLKGVYFVTPSATYGEFFSTEDRALLHDLEKFAIPVYWADPKSGKLLHYVEKADHDSGLFVPIDQVDTFIHATLFGLYGSNLLTDNFDHELKSLLIAIEQLRKSSNHRLLNADTPLALVTGGGPGTMETGNRIAKELGILSCANIIDFSQKEGPVNEQKQNPYIEAKMTYRLDKLVERQAEFNLDFPIFLTGGIGTDFEYALEEVRRKVGAVKATPILLFGKEEYWKEKVSPRFRSNLKHGTIKGSEWTSNCFYCVDSAALGLEVYRRFFDGTLPIGKDGPTYEEGFCLAKNL